MSDSRPIRISAIFCCVLGLAFVLSPPTLQAQWKAVIGADRADQGKQALAFLPNELWIHLGDDITWTSAVNEIHTVTFLTDGQVRPFFGDGCPGFTVGSGVFDGSTCLTTPPLAKGDTFRVTFPNAGNYKLVCLVHENMTGVVHVLSPATPLPHDQKFYDKQASSAADDLLSDLEHSRHHGSSEIVAGTGEVVASAGGSHTASLLRFDEETKIIRVGDTVEWTNQDPVTPHTITFGAEPSDPGPPSPNVTVDADGARHATINSTADNVHSGFIVAAPQERLGLAQAPLGFTRFRVTFTHAGTYDYICALHNDLGMKGKIKVNP
jgi:plastocyanin